MNIRHAVIPAAGLGTRFLPFTKSIPKELLPLLGRPSIEYILQEGLSSGVTDFALITNDRKSAIQNHLSKDEKLIAQLALHNKQTKLDALHALIDICRFSYITQDRPRGLGHAISLTENIIDQEYFGIMLPDDIILSEKPGLAQLMQIAQMFSCSVLAVQEVKESDVSRYGIIDIAHEVAPNVYQVAHLVEKPSPKQAPSNLGIIGRYVLSNHIFQSLAQCKPGKDVELQLTDAIEHMNTRGHRVLAYKIDGTRFDIGTPHGWLEALIAIASQDASYAPIVERTSVKYLHNFQQKSL